MSHRHHKDLKSLENYTGLSTKQQMHMSKILSNAMTGSTLTSSEYENHTATPSPCSDSQNTGKLSNPGQYSVE